ncbi:MAG: excinuclease ABC subunit UvrA, partial [Actinomycetota bacterium]|nr:excinuclease ABC subunit UvrA [Actinomycetota bacterium]
MAQEELVVHGAREHNLKDITVRLPRNRLICITGLSGSGKSSLAFDTIYAEGQRRYVESLSAYARQFLQMMEKPDVDSIDGLSPAISIDQKTTSRNPRSTVGTVTEIYDYLRLLYARIGKPHCPVCGRPIAGQSQEAIVDQILQLPDRTKFTVNAPVVRDRKGEFKDLLEELRAEGFTRVKVDGEVKLLEESIELDKKFKHTIEVVVDRLVLKPDLRTRLAQSVETAAQLADGLVEVDVFDGESMTFSENFACPEHGVGLPELEPRIFSFNSPHGACPRCTGLGAQQEIDPDLLVPDPSLSIDDGALVPWAVGGSSFYESVIQAIADRYEIDLEIPWQDLSEEQQNLFLFGTDGDKVYIQYRNRMGRRRSYMLAFEGIVASLERRYRETDSSQSRERIEEYMSLRPCPVCNGARLKPEVLAVTVGGKNIHEFTRMSVQRAIEFVDGLDLTETEQLIAVRILKEIRERLTFLENVGVGYLQLDRAASTLSGGEAQRLRLATQIGSQLVGVLYILDEPSIGLHQRDNGKLIGTLERLRDLGNTVLVVEHDEQMMRAADHLVDMGPGAGVHGGHVVAEGTAKAVERNAKSITGQFLSGKREIAIPERRTDDLGT